MQKLEDISDNSLGTDPNIKKQEYDYNMSEKQDNNSADIQKYDNHELHEKDNNITEKEENVTEDGNNDNFIKQEQYFDDTFQGNDKKEYVTNVTQDNKNEIHSNTEASNPDVTISKTLKIHRLPEFLNRRTIYSIMRWRTTKEIFRGTGKIHVCNKSEARFALITFKDEKLSSQAKHMLENLDNLVLDITYYHGQIDPETFVITKKKKALKTMSRTPTTNDVPAKIMRAPTADDVPANIDSAPTTDHVPAEINSAPTTDDLPPKINIPPTTNVSAKFNSDPTTNNVPAKFNSDPTTNNVPAKFNSDPTTNNVPAKFNSDPTTNNVPAKFNSDPTTNNVPAKFNSEPTRNNVPAKFNSDPTTNNVPAKFNSDPTTNNVPAKFNSDPTTNNVPAKFNSEPTTNNVPAKFNSDPTTNNVPAKFNSDPTTNNVPAKFNSEPTRNNVPAKFNSDPTTNNVPAKFNSEPTRNNVPAKFNSEPTRNNVPAKFNSDPTTNNVPAKFNSEPTRNNVPAKFNSEPTRNNVPAEGNMPPPKNVSVASQFRTERRQFHWATTQDDTKQSRILHITNLPSTWNRNHVKDFIAKQSSENPAIVKGILCIFIGKTSGPCTNCHILFRKPHLCTLAKELLQCKDNRIPEGHILKINYDYYNDIIVWSPNDAANINAFIAFLMTKGKYKIRNNRPIQYPKPTLAPVINTNSKYAQHITGESSVFWQKPFWTCRKPDENDSYGLSPAFLKYLGITPPLVPCVIAENIPIIVEEPTLRQMFSLAGTVVEVTIISTYFGKHKVKVVYDHPVEAVQAISMFNGQVMYGMRMNIFMDSSMPYNEDEAFPYGLQAIGPGLRIDGRPLREVRTTLELQKAINMLTNKIDDLKNSFDDLRRSITTGREASPSQPKLDQNSAVFCQNQTNPSCNPVAQNFSQSQEPFVQFQSQPQVGCFQVGSQMQPGPSSVTQPQMPNVYQQGLLFPYGSNGPQNSSGSYMQSGCQSLDVTPMQTTPERFQKSVGPFGQMESYLQGGSQLPSVAGSFHMPYEQCAAAVQYMANGPQIQNIQYNQVNSQRQQGSNEESGSSVTSKPQTSSAPCKQDKQQDEFKRKQDLKTTATDRRTVADKPNGEKDDRRESCTVKFAYLPPSVSLSALRSKMLEVGRVLSAEMTGRGRATVTFATPKEAYDCYKLLDHTKVDGQVIEVRYGSK